MSAIHPALSFSSTRARYAGVIARPALLRLKLDAEKYPRSYGRDRVMAEADAILDAALDEAADTAVKFSVLPSCVVCDDLGCEFCPKAS